MQCDHTIETLRVLALAQSEMVRYLPEHDGSVVYAAEDNDSQVPFAAEATLRIAYQVTNAAWVDAPEVIKPFLREICCVIVMMLDLAEQIDYMWFLDKEKYSITGPYDTAWQVLRRLATLALQAAECDVQLPTITFGEFLKLGGLRPKCRQAPFPE